LEKNSEGILVTDTIAGKWREFALLICLALLWGSSYLFIRVAVDEIPPLTLIAIRVTVASLVLIAVAIWRGIRLPRDLATWRLLFIQSILNSIGAWTLLAWGQQYIDSGLASVLNSTSPIFVFLITLFITRHESAHPWRLAGACVGLLGVILIVGPDVLTGLGQQVAGQFAALASAMLYGVAAIYGRRFAHLPATATALGTMLWATAVLVPACLIADQPWQLSPSPRALIAAMLLGVFCTGLAMLIYFRLLRTLGSLATASQSYLRAGFGVMLGMVVLGEQLTPLVGIGLLAALAGVALINLPPRERISR
jgi:drug/metabolite transporter (DMT)-like permease